MIVVFVYAAVQRILDGDDGVRDFSRFQAAKHIFKPLAGRNVDMGAEQFAGSRMAKRAGLSLKGDELLIFFGHFNCLL
jgi:hypothetical protein